MSRAKSEVDPRVIPLGLTLEAIFTEVTGLKYQHGGAKDMLALKRLVTVANDDEIRAAWRRGLTASGFDQVHTYAELAAKSNRLRAKEQPNPHVYREPTFAVDSTNPKEAPFGKCSVCDKGAWALLHVPHDAIQLSPFCASEDDAHLKAQMRGAYWPGADVNYQHG